MSYLALGKAPVVISTQSPECLGVMLGANAMAAAASGAWQTLNSARYIPFVISDTIVVKRLFSFNGTAVSGNIDMGLYNEGGTRLVSIGSTAQSGTSQPQFFDITDTTIGPGRYYIGVAMDNTTGTLFMQNVAGDADLLRPWGVLYEASAFALPATATFAVVLQPSLPLVGLTTRTTD